jgi:hypothetical protein
MKKNLATIAVIVLLIGNRNCFAQTDPTQLALNISKAYSQNLDELKKYVWKRTTDLYMDTQKVATVITGLSFTADGKLAPQVIDTKSYIKQKPGIRGNMQDKKVDELTDYYTKALAQSFTYLYMSKGDLVDFFDKAKVDESGADIVATAKDVKVKGDELTLTVDKKTFLLKKQQYKTLMGADPVTGDMTYKQYENGLNTVSNMNINMPAKKLKGKATNYDFAKKL